MEAHSVNRWMQRKWMDAKMDGWMRKWMDAKMDGCGENGGVQRKWMDAAKMDGCSENGWMQRKWRRAAKMDGCSEIAGIIDAAGGDGCAQQDFDHTDRWLHNG